MFEDFIKGIRDYISDRFMSPLGASLTVSWCAWNYKALLIVFSGESAIRKIHLIHLVYQDAGYSWLHLAVGPLITAAFYILVFPYPSNWVYSYSLRRRKEALSLKRSIEDQTVLTQEESRSIRARFEEIEREHTGEALRLNGRIDSLKDQLKQATSENDDLLRRLAEAGANSTSAESSQEDGDLSRIELGKVQWRVLDALGRHGTAVSIPTLSTELRLSEAVIWIVAGELQDIGLVHREDEDSDARVTRHAWLTYDGLRVFMKRLE